MRIISGKAGGLKLLTPRGTNTRPTADRVKEALFSILENAGLLHNAKVLDLFAGSGALGIEAISRGAKSCCFVDKNRQAIEAVQANLSHTGFTDSATVLRLDAEKAIQILAAKNHEFDLVLLDAPYNNGVQGDFLKRIMSEVVRPGGTVVIETSNINKQIEKYDFCKLYDRRDYGDTSILFYTTEENHDL